MSLTDEELEFYYARFDADHERLARELMARLPDMPMLSHAVSESNNESQQTYELMGEWYDRFDEDHARLEKELISSLPDIYPATKSKNIGTWLDIRSHSPVFRAAVCLLIFVTAVFFLSTSMTRPAYALQDVFDRMFQANRLHLRGTHRAIHSKIEFPIEIYLERPDKFWKSIFYNRGDTTGFGQHAGDGQVRYKTLEDERAPNWATKDLSCWAAVELEKIVSSMIGEDFLSGNARQFDYDGTETVNGKRCDVYTRKSTQAIYSRLYVDQITLNPVRAVTYYIDEQGNEIKIRDLDHIVVEPQEIPKHVSFSPPTDLPVEPAPSPVRRFDSLDQGRKIYMPIILDMGHGSILACWSSAYPNATFSLALPDGTDVTTEVIDLPQTDDGTTTWNWILLKPTEISPSNPGYSVHSQFAVTEDSSSPKLPYYRLPIKLSDRHAQEVLDSFSNATMSLAEIRSSLTGFQHFQAN